MVIVLFICGLIAGALVQFLLESPWENLVEKRFQQILHVGVYRKLFFKNVNYNELKNKLIKAVKQYDFESAKIILKQLEWFVEEKTIEEKEEARKIAQVDYDKDLKLINKFKGNKNNNKYMEEKNKWVREKIIKNLTKNLPTKSKKL